MNCKKCGGDISEGLNFCPACGAEIKSEATNSDIKAENTEVVTNEVVTNIDDTEVVTNFDPKESKKGRTVGVVIGIVAAVLVIVLRIVSIVLNVSGAGDFQRETPDDLDHSTYVYTYEDGSTLTMVYGHKDDVVYTEEDIYTYNTVGWSQADIDETIAFFDEYAEALKNIECYKYTKDVSMGELVFTDYYFDLAKAESLKALSEAGKFDVGDDEYDDSYISMKLTEEDLLVEGFVKK